MFDVSPMQCSMLNHYAKCWTGCVWCAYLPTLNDAEIFKLWASVLVQELGEVWVGWVWRWHSPIVRLQSLHQPPVTIWSRGGEEEKKQRKTLSGNTSCFLRGWGSITLLTPPQHSTVQRHLARSRGSISWCVGWGYKWVAAVFGSHPWLETHQGGVTW